MLGLLSIIIVQFVADSLLVHVSTNGFIVEYYGLPSCYSSKDFLLDTKVALVSVHPTKFLQ